MEPPGREWGDHIDICLLMVCRQPLNQAGITGWHVLHEHEDEFLLRETHQWDGRDVEWTIGGRM